MAYRRKRTTYKLEWESGEFAGLEVRVRSIPIGKMLDVMPVFERLQKATGTGGDLSIEALGDVRAALQPFCDSLVSWNIEDEDEEGNVTPVPATADGLLSLDPKEMTEITQAWMKAIASVPDPLEQPSSDGLTALEGSIPMVALSSNPESLPTPS